MFPATTEQRSAAGIPRDAALQLLHVVAQVAADEAGAHLLFIKGAASASIGLRPLWGSADVDALCAPSAYTSILDALTRKGWRVRAADADTQTFPRHSASLFHEDWPCDLDLHFQYPGMEIDPSVAFSRLWQQRRDCVVGGRTISISGRSDSILIAALHALRDPRDQRREIDLRLLRSAEFDADTLVRRAAELGALACARPFLEQLTLLVPPEDWGVPSRVWRRRALDAHTRRFVAFREGTWSDRFRALRWAILPPVTTLVKDRPAKGRVPIVTVCAALLRRWARGLRDAPSSITKARRYRRDSAR